MTDSSQTIPLPNNESAIALSGNKEINLQLISRQTGVKTILRGQDLLIVGREKAVDRATKIVRSLFCSKEVISILGFIGLLSSDRS